MTLWFVFALMTAAAIFAVLLPVGRRAQIRSRIETAVYCDQLDEIARDRAAGLIGEAVRAFGEGSARCRMRRSRRLGLES